jgi:uncharacterized protein (DUF1501 family)
MMKKINRREFLKTTAATTALAVTTPIMASQKTKAKDDYKALVCVLLDGGADSLNMLVPKNDEDYNNYKKARKNLALEQNSLRELRYTNHAFHPKMPRMQRMFNSDNLAVISNVGALNKPITHDEIASFEALKDIPESIFSHDKQHYHIMTLGNNDIGWAAKVADFLDEDLVNISVNGQNLMQHGSEKENFIAHDDYGVVEDPKEILKKLSSLGIDVDFEYDKSSEHISLSKQLELVAKLIDAREKANFPKRQIYFVKQSGWDTHDRGDEDRLLENLDRSFHAFATTLEKLGVKDNVITFSMSEFGRTMRSNSSGADHGWGGHAFAFGGGVRSGIHGVLPQIKPNSPDAIANTAIAPTISHQQYVASMVDWLCDGKADLDQIFPSLARFDKKTLDFIA